MLFDRPRYIVLLVCLALGVMSVPARAEEVPQGQIDALALLALAPQMCGIDTEQRWKVTMSTVAAQYSQPIDKLAVDVKRAIRELGRDLRNKPQLVQSQCALLR